MTFKGIINEQTIQKVISHDMIISGYTTVNGHVSVYDMLTVGGTSTLTGNVDMDGTLKVDGTSTLTGNVDMDGTLKVGGTSTLTGNVDMDGTLTVGETSTLNGTLKVDGTSTLTGNVDMDGTLKVGGTSTLTGNVDTDGTLTVGGTSTLTGNVDTDGTLTVGGTSTLNDDLVVSGTSTLTGNVDTDGTLTVGGTSTLTGNVDTDGTLTVGGTSTLSGNVDTDGTLTVGGKSTLTGNVDTDGTLKVGGTSTLTGNVDMDGTLTVGGNTILADLSVTDKLELTDNSFSVGVGVTNINSIVLNASGSVLDSNNEGLFVKPIRSINDSSNLKTLYYNPTTYEIFEGANAETTVVPVYSANTYYAELGGYVIMVNTAGTHGVVMSTIDQGLSSDGITNRGPIDWHAANYLTRERTYLDFTAEAREFFDWRLPEGASELLMMYVSGAEQGMDPESKYWSNNRAISTNESEKFLCMQILPLGDNDPSNFQSDITLEWRTETALMKVRSVRTF
jgi:cytoskeletal protein CcmA (bactofilin family)